MKTTRKPALALAAVLASIATFSFATEPDWQPLLDKDLSQWEIWMGVPHTSVTGLPPGTPQADKPQDGTPLGLNQDPKHVFTVFEEDGQPVLKVSGEIYAGLTTLKEFQNYHFSAEVKWGERKWAPRLDRRRDSGFLYHCTGPHGAFWNVWMRCVEFQIQENDLGDLYMLAGSGGTLRVKLRENPAQGEAAAIWDPSEAPIRIGRVQRSANFESPHGEWNRIEVYTIGDRSVHLVNGHVVLAIDQIHQKDADTLDKGKLQLQSEGAEVYYRDVKLRPISEFPADINKTAQF